MGFRFCIEIIEPFLCKNLFYTGKLMVAVITIVLSFKF